MTAVLLDSRKMGSGGWVFLKEDGLALQVSGMLSGDRVGVAIHPQGEELFIAENSTLLLPEGVVRLRATHYEAVQRESGGVCIDLVRSNGHLNP